MWFNTYETNLETNQFAKADVNLARHEERNFGNPLRAHL